MRERVSVDSMAASTGIHGIRKLSFGSSILSHGDRGFQSKYNGAISTSPPAKKQGSAGFQVNLLEKSLATKLKQYKFNSLPSSQGSPVKGHSKFPRHPSKTESAKAIKSILTRQDTWDPSKPSTSSLVGSTQSSMRACSGTSAERQHPSLRCPSATSTASDKALHSSRSKASKTGSRRSNSAGQLRSPSSQAVTERARSELAYMDQLASGLSFKSSGTDCTIKVIKRDGVFKPVDKYAPGRYELRDMGYLSRKAACDYDTYIIPLCNDEYSVPVPCDITSPRGYQDSGKRHMKVSWNVFDEDVDEEGAELRLDSQPVPTTPYNVKRAVSTDYMAYKRPIYSKGRSKVASIGLKWTIPTVAPEEPVKVEHQSQPQSQPQPQPTNTKKPMWSYLVTHETKQQDRTHKTRGGLVAPPPTTTTFTVPSSTSSTTMDVRIRHSKDVHPVSTAMNREGTSVSKTKWKVPSSNASTLDAERAVMGRLEFVKRPRPYLLHDQGRGTSNSAAQRYRDAIMEKENEERLGSTSRYVSRKSNDSEDEIDYTTRSSTRRDDQISSPTKSRSTYY